MANGQSPINATLFPVGNLPVVRQINTDVPTYQPCQYVATAAVATLAGITAALDLAGNTLAANDRALCPYAGAICGIYVYSGSAWAADPNFIISEGATVKVLRGATAPTQWQQMSNAAPPVFASDDRTASGIRTASTVVVVSSATAPTAGKVLTATAGNAADWEHWEEAQTVVWPPPDGDAGAALNDLMTAENARTNGPRTIVQTPGTYTYTTTVYAQNNIDILTHVLAINVNAIPTHVDPTDSSFVCSTTQQTLVQTLAADVNVGDKSFTLTAAPTILAVGDKIYFSNGPQRVYPQEVTAIVGAVVTCKDPFIDTFSHTTQGTVTKYLTYVKNFKIRGKGLFTFLDASSGARLIELIGATDCEVSDITLDDSVGWSQYGSFGLSVDNGCLGCKVTNVTVTRYTPDSSTQVAFGNESSRSCEYINCRTSGFWIGLQLYGSIKPIIDGGKYEARPSTGVAGIELLDAGTKGVIGAVIRNSQTGSIATGGSQRGITVTAVTDLLIENHTFLGNSGEQLEVESTIAGTDVLLKNPTFKVGGGKFANVATGSKLRIEGGKIDAAAVYSTNQGISYSAGSSGYVDGLDIEANIAQPIFLNCTIPVRNVTCASAMFVVCSGTFTGIQPISGCKFTQVAPQPNYCSIVLYNAINCNVSLSDTDIHLPDANANALAIEGAGSCSNCSVTLNGVRTTGGSTGTGVKGVAGVAFIVGTGNDLSSCGTPYDATAIANAKHLVTAAGVA
jgi:hypothetical protein